jgi:hypothetical protein
MRYPANRVISLLQMYDALSHNVTLVDQLVMPSIKVEVEAYLSRAMCVDRMAVFHFNDSLMHQWREAVAMQAIYNPQNLLLAIPKDRAVPVTISWDMLLQPTARRSVNIDLNLCEADADMRYIQQQGRLEAITQLIRKECPWTI